VVITQAQADAIKAFLDRLRAAAPAALRFAIDRERARIEREPWAGLTMDEAVEQLDLLSCEGFEDALFCGEITGDCRITASDALAVLRIAVGTIASVAEADLDGSGSVTASDALQTLRIAVGTQANVTTCND